MAEPEATQLLRAAREELGLWRMLVNEGGVPRYTITPGAALNEVVTGTDGLLRRIDAHRSTTPDAVEAMRRKTLEEARDVAIGQSNFGHVEGNRRAFLIADLIGRRIDPKGADCG